MPEGDLDSFKFWAFMGGHDRSGSFKLGWCRRGQSIRTDKQPKDKVFGQDILGTSGTQTSGYPGQELYASGLFLLF